MKRIVSILALAGLIGSWLSGCNTVAGVGRDVERAGEAIQRSTK